MATHMRNFDGPPSIDLSTSPKGSVLCREGYLIPEGINENDVRAYQLEITDRGASSFKNLSNGKPPETIETYIYVGNFAFKDAKKVKEIQSALCNEINYQFCLESQNASCTYNATIGSDGCIILSLSSGYYGQYKIIDGEFIDGYCDEIEQ